MLARDLETAGEAAALAFVREELAALLGARFARGLAPLAVTAWGREPTILGSYSHALPDVGRRPRRPGRAGEPAPLLRRRGLLAARLLDRPRRLAERARGGGPDRCRLEAARPGVTLPPVPASPVREADALSFFESLLLLLAVAILLLQVTRRLSIPYPTMLAAAGVGLALIPGAPQIALDPDTALALFIAPALVDAAFDFPAVAARKLWQPLFALAVLAVVLSATAVAGLGVALAGLPLYAALALGAIVAPPDAAAATAILGGVSMPGRVVAVLKGESLLNDASALLLFAAATSVHGHEAADAAFALRIAIAVPGGVLLGILLALFFRRFVMPFVTGTLGGNLLEFVTASASGSSPSGSSSRPSSAWSPSR